MSAKKNLILDSILLTVFLVCIQPSMTGISIHEWLSLAAFGTIVVHQLSHWSWVVKVTRKFFRKLFHASRLNYVLNFLFFIDFIAVMLSGLMISRSVMPALGLVTLIIVGIEKLIALIMHHRRSPAVTPPPRPQGANPCIFLLFSKSTK